MLENKKIYAIITARGGSKGLPRKNVLNLNGNPLISYSIKAALDCPYIEKCFVTTEDPEIKSVSQSSGAFVIDRPTDLAQDHSTSAETILHALRTLENQNDLPNYFVLLQPTSPLRTAEHLKSAIEGFDLKKFKSLVSVSECDHHPYKTIEIKEGKLTPIKDFESLETPRQKLPKFYQTNGAIYLISSQDFKKHKKFVLDPCQAFVMDQQASIDIDSKIDFLLVEKLLNSES